MSTATIRPASAHEAGLLTDLALRSKAYWGYDAVFMAACVPALTVTPEMIATQPVYVLDADGVRGFYTLKILDTRTIELDMLFIDPTAIGRGYGKALWQHALTTARSHGFIRMIVEADPNAEAFYSAMGMTRYGERESTILKGRMLPLLELKVTTSQ